MSLTWGKVRDFDYQHLAQWAECQVSCGRLGVATLSETFGPRASRRAGAPDAESSSPAGIHLAGTPPRKSGKSEGSPVELPSVFHLPNWKVFVAGIGFWAVIYRLWK
jgi:hypothetical protein